MSLLPVNDLSQFLSTPISFRISTYNKWASQAICASNRVYRLHNGLALKIYQGDANETDAYRYISTLHGVNKPRLIDSVVSDDNRLYLLTTWVDGPTVEDIWEELSQRDRDWIVVDLRRQMKGVRHQSSRCIISNVAGGPIDDVRLPWVEEPRTYSTHREFAREVWPFLDMPHLQNTLKPILTPLIERDDVPIVFTHGDLLPKNLIIPISKDHWLRTREPICIIDWESAGWKPLYWEALRATFFEFEKDTEWTKVVRKIFPDCTCELDADWRWRSESHIAIV
jgi:thiamine kinase-like enzyme